MAKISNKWTKTIVLTVVTVSLIVTASSVRADRFDEQINTLNQLNGQLQNTKDHLNIEASTINGKVANLQTQISALETEIQDKQIKYDNLTGQMRVADADLTKQKTLLGEIILEMHHADQLSTIEMLATSKNLSDYVDQQEYKASVEKKVQTGLQRILELKKQIQVQKDTLGKLLADQQAMRTQLDKEKAESSSLLAYNLDQQAGYTQQVTQNNATITDLRRQQAQANAKLFKSGVAPKGTQGGGGYPASWANAPMDSIVDTWGMYNRECVSYTAWKVASTGRYMPYWGGRGNAKQWPDNARAAGIAVDSSPRVGDVAISTRGTYGHSMYVEAVNNDGTVSVSQYNAAWDGNYSTARVLIGGLQFIHF